MFRVFETTAVSEVGISYGSKTRPLQADVSVSIFDRTLLWCYAEGMHANFKEK